jgi:HK97 family phage prohead protease
MRYVKPQESRSYKGTVEVRDGANGPMIVGYGAVFNRRSADMGFVEQVDPDAFTKTLSEADVRGLANHDPNWLIGRTKSGTMRLRTDPNGLYYEIDVNPADPDGQRALAKVQRGDWDGSSFSFTAVRDEWNWDASPPERRLLEVALIDVGPVTFPAYPDATATSRALEPIAERLGKPVDVLVSALGRGEIRSLINGGDMETETVEEERAGKAISAANMEKIRAAYDNLRDLMDVALTNAPADSEVGDAAELEDPDDPAENSRNLAMLAVELEMRQRVVALEAA